jgi:hypothetical protein
LTDGPLAAVFIDRSASLIDVAFMATDVDLLTVFEAAELLAYIPARLKRLARAGKVPCVILPGNELRFVQADLVDWIAQHRQEVVSDA